MRGTRILQNGTRHILRGRGDDVQHKKSVLILGHFFCFRTVLRRYYPPPLVRAISVLFPAAACLDGGGWGWGLGGKGEEKPLSRTLT